MQLPAFEAKTPPAAFGSRESEGDGPGGQPAARVTKRRRKLLLKSAPLSPAANASASDAPPPRADPAEWRRLSLIQEGRKRLMKDVCAKYKSSSKRTVTPYHVSRIFVEDKHKLLYCEVPKAGCSNWKRVLLVLEGFAPSTREIQHNTVHYGNHLKRLDSFNYSGISHRLETYTKVLFVREPFERLVSAFRDKFEHPNSYYHPVFGRPIISKYRVNASRAALRTGAGVTFKEFMQYLLDVHKPVGMDIHWEHVNRLCSPCLVDYDFIGRFESMEEDANFLLHLTGAPRNLTFPSFKDRHSHEERTSARLTQQYFAQLTPSERQRAYDFYYMDYLMFNYSKPFQDLY
ncbi:CHST8 sulfotransferase, partial [Atractosteus spatula]|nr:CHST8 sulfotransferase [Atractosteus spatula]